MSTTTPTPSEGSMFTHVPVKRSFLAALALAAAALPAGAQGRVILDPPNEATASQPVPQVTVVRQPQARASEGFQWGDAGIGAAGAIVLLGAGAGAATTIRRRRTNRVATA